MEQLQPGRPPTVRITWKDILLSLNESKKRNRDELSDLKRKITSHEIYISELEEAIQLEKGQNSDNILLYHLS